MEELRKSPRLKLDIPIDQLIVYEPEEDREASERYIAARALDISEGGLAAESSYPVHALRHVYVVLRPDGRRQIRSEGYIAHVSPAEGLYRFGIKFISLDHEAELWLTELTRKTTGSS